MAKTNFCEETIDDLMHSIIEEINKNGLLISPGKGKCREISGVMLEIINPRARLSLTETKGKLFSCIGELCWYLAQTNDAEFIAYYISKYKDLAEDNIIFGGYGPRFFNWKNLNQIERVISKLRKNEFSRRAVIQIFDANDLVEYHEDVPCTCLIQFLVRNKKLNMISYMRSNDVLIGLPHDIFCFTMIQEIIARSLFVEIGYYKHFVGSMHYYEENKEKVDQFLNEGWQSTNRPMQEMPKGDPWPAINMLIKAEADIRLNGSTNIDLDILDPYWADLIRLLIIFKQIKENNIEGVNSICENVSSDLYKMYINYKIKQMGENISGLQ